MLAKCWPTISTLAQLALSQRLMFAGMGQVNVVWAVWYGALGGCGSFRSKVLGHTPESGWQEVPVRVRINAGSASLTLARHWSGHGPPSLSSGQSDQTPSSPSHLGVCACALVRGAVTQKMVIWALISADICDHSPAGWTGVDLCMWKVEVGSK